jgi:hypothetical protein
MGFVTRLEEIDLAIDGELLRRQIAWVENQPDCPEKEGLLRLLGHINEIVENTN